MPSKYQPQLSCWREDLYKGIYTTQLHLGNNERLRYANDDYCEFSRRLTGMNPLLRLLMITIATGIILISTFGLYMVIRDIVVGEEYSLMFLPCGFVAIFIIHFFLSMSLNIFFAPTDFPIRLNRKTGKVYIYDHFLLYFGSWSTFIRSPFRAKEITIKEFDWIDIQGVMTSVSMTLASGGMVRTYRIECVVCEPNSNHIADHFILSTHNSLYYDEWKWINSYMAFSDNNLDAEFMPEEEFSWPIKINWPEEIDKKSKASSLEEYQRIDDEYKKIKED